ncbi:MAG: hypothetical protein LPJ94_03570 [Thauera sp.]|nr:hypothetical protein [Thauera sp.]
MRRALLFLFGVLPAVAQAEVYKCRIGERTVYQEAPCERPEQARPIAERMTVVEPYPYRLAPQKGTTTDKPKPATKATARSDAGEHPSCQSLRDRIRKIDIAARHRSTPTLTEQRRKAKQRLSALRCSEMDPR